MKDRWSWKIPAREKRGTYLILAVASFLIPVRWWVSFQEDNQESYWKQVDHWMDSIESASTNAPEISEIHQKDFFIDPAFASKQELQKAGFPVFLAERLIRYRKKGGRLNSRNDLQKLYGMTDSIMERVSPFLVFGNRDESLERLPKRNGKERVGLSFTIDLNPADSSDLLKLNGIGPVLSGRIIKYRRKLGGFYRREQLLEVYGMDSLIFEKNPGIWVNADSIQRLSLKKMTFRELNAHPYVDYESAKKIFQARKEGKVNKPEDLLNEGLLSPDLYSKLAPYLME